VCVCVCVCVMRLCMCVHWYAMEDGDAFLLHLLMNKQQSGYVIIVVSQAPS